MTISAYIVELLKNYEGIEIDMNHMPDGSDKYGLFKSPSRNIKDFTDGSYEITEYYQFNARQTSLSSVERKEADEWLEDLAYWADDFPYNYDFPQIDKNRTVGRLDLRILRFRLILQPLQMHISLIQDTRQRDVA